MGYTTDFSGSFSFDRKIEQKHADYLRAFNQTRRMKRDADKALAIPDPIREAVGLPIGDEGAYFVGSPANYGQDDDGTIINYNSSPSNQPGLWCGWTVSDDNDAIEWDGGEKFYDYVEWLEYLIKHFIQPWGYKLKGTVQWDGEDFGDVGKITVKNNVVKARHLR